MKIVTFTTDVRGTSFCAMKSLAGSLILRNEVYLFEFFAAFLNSSTNSDSVLVAPEQWLECQQKWRECSKPAAVPDVSTFMKEHFKFFSFARESSGLNDSTSDSQFQHTMEWAIGLTMTAADNSGRNGFWTRSVWDTLESVLSLKFSHRFDIACQHLWLLHGTTRACEITSLDVSPGSFASTTRPSIFSVL